MNKNKHIFLHPQQNPSFFHMIMGTSHMWMDASGCWQHIHHPQEEKLCCSFWELKEHAD